MTKQKLQKDWEEFKKESNFDAQPQNWKEQQEKDFKIFLEGGKVWNHLFCKYTEGVTE